MVAAKERTMSRPRYSGHTLAMCILLALLWAAVLAVELMPW